MEIKRERYLDRLINRKNNGLIKVITGIGRSGKSYLLFNLYYKYLLSTGVSEDNIIAIPLDDDDFAAYRDPHELYEYIKSKLKNQKQQYYIFIDEAQFAITKEEMKNPDVPIRLYSILNGLLQKNNVDVYITGSNSKFLSSDIMTEFRGRGDEVHIAPLSFSEYYPASGKDKADAWNEYLYYGGLPHILAEEDEEGKGRYLERLNKEIYLRDLSERYDIKGRRYISTPAKYYYTDLGLRNALLNFRQFEQTHLMENAIYNELIYRGYNVDVGVVEIRIEENGRKVRKQLEVDFVINQASKRYYIQSAFSLPDREKILQEQASLVRIPDSFKKIIVVGNNQPVWRTEEGITVIGIFDFMLNKDSLDV